MSPTVVLSCASATRSGSVRIVMQSSMAAGPPLTAPLQRRPRRACVIFRRMGEGGASGRDWLVRGERVGPVAPNREDFVARWDRYDDPRIAMAAAFQSGGAAAIFKPPMTR